MPNCLLKRGFVIGILMALVLLNFIPPIDSISISLEKQFNILSSEDEKFTNFQYFNNYISHYALN